jgi:hypothetical protein
MKAIRLEKKMAGDFSETRRDLVDIIISIRQTLDRRLDVRKPQDFDAMQTISMRLEGLRYILNQFRLPSRRQPISRDIMSLYTQRLIREAVALQDSIEFQEHLSNVKYRMAVQPASRSPALFIPEITGNQEATVADALRAFVRIAVEETEPDLVDKMKPEAERAVMQLRNIVPGQKIAPVQFEVTRGRLQIAHQDAKSRARDLDNVNSARGVIIERGHILIQHLESTNCDRRLLETVEALQSKLVDQNDIIQLGIMNIGCEAVFDQFANELPDAIVGMLRAHSTNINLYVAQFPQWAQFTENAAVVELNEDDIRNAISTAGNIIERLVNTEEAVDPEVPKTIDMLKSLVENPRHASKRAAFALIRTIENLVSKIFDYGSSFLDQTISRTSEKTSKAISNIVMVSLLALAVESATSMSSVAGKLGDTAWMARAAEIVKEQLSSVKVFE